MRNNINPIKILNQNYSALLLIFFAPAMGGLIRKFIPEQPNFIEPLLTVIVISIVMVFYTGHKPWHVRKSPKWLLQPVVIWVFVLTIYTVPGLFISFSMVGMVIAIRFMPMLMVPIACNTLRTREDLRIIAQVLGYMALVFLPLGIVVTLFGNDALPFFLRPIRKLSELGRGQKGGFDTCALIFNAEQTLAFSVLTIQFLCLTVMQFDKTRVRLYWSILISCIVLLFISTQRGAFYAGLIGMLVHFIIQKGSNKKLSIVIFLFIIIAVSIIDKYSHPDTVYQHLDSRTTLMTKMDIGNRIENIFWNVGSFWIKETPWGTFVGFAGPEGAVFGRKHAATGNDIIETGFAQLIAEIGVLGSIIMPFLVLSIVIMLLKRSKNLPCRQSVIILVTFFVSFFILYYMKACGLMMTMTIAQLAFWAFPGIATALISMDKRELKIKRIQLIEQKCIENGIRI